MALAALARPAAADGTCGALYDDGHAALLAHRNADAIASLEKCIAASPRCLPCYDDLGWAHWSRSEWDAAIGAWERSLKVSPGRAKSKANIGKVKSARASVPQLRAPIGTRS